MGKREEVKDMYGQLRWLLDAGEFGGPWGGNPTDDEGKVSEDVLGDFYFFLTDLYKEKEPEWVFMYLQIYSWHYQSIHEGPMSFYTNTYDVDREDGIRRLSEGLRRYGYHELARWYDYGIFDYKLYPHGDFPEEQYLREGEIMEWIDENPEAIWEVYVDLLLKMEGQLLQDAQAAGNERKKKSTLEPEQRRRNSEEDDFAPIIQLGETGRGDFLMKHLDFSQLDEAMASRMAEAQKVNRIQTVKDIPGEVLEILDRKIFALRGDILFRVFRGDKNDTYDIKDFEKLRHLRQLGIGSVRDVEHAEVLAGLQGLEDLALDLEGRKDYGFVNDLPEGITNLTIHIGQEMEECNFGSGTPYDMGWWLRFSRLRKCYVGKLRKHMELVTREDSVRELFLVNVPCPKGEFLNQLRIVRIVVRQEHAEGLEILGKVKALEEVELVGMGELQSLDFLAELPNLRKVVLYGLLELTGLPHFPKGHGLKELEVRQCKKLKDISGVREVECLKKLTLYNTDVSKEDVKDITSRFPLQFDRY